MTGKEALEILNQVTEIHNLLMDDDERSAFFYLGVLSEQLAEIVKIEEDLSKPTSRCV